MIRKKKPQGEGVERGFNHLNDLMKGIGGLDDRGLVLSLAAFAEDSLKNLISSFLVPSDAADDLVEGFNAPLGTFSARIKASYAMGLLTEVQFQDLERLRQIRNFVAHSWKPISLESLELRDIVRNLSPSRLDLNFHDSLTARFRSSIVSSLTEIESSANQNRLKKIRTRAVGSHLYPGFAGAGFAVQFDQASTELQKLEDELASATGDRLRFYRAHAEVFFTRLLTLPRDRTADENDLCAGLFLKVTAMVDRHKLKLMDDDATRALVRITRRIMAERAEKAGGDVGAEPLR